MRYSAQSAEMLASVCDVRQSQWEFVEILRFGDRQEGRGTRKKEVRRGTRRWEREEKEEEARE